METTPPVQPVGNPALLVVDVQDAFVGMLPNGEDLLGRCCFAVEAATLFEMPVIMTAQVPEKLGPLNERIKGLAFGAAYFEKSAFSALRAEGVMDYIHNKRIDHLLLAGLETSVCVYQTVLDAMLEGLGVTVLTDCIGCRRKKDGKAVLDFLKTQTTATIVPAETVLYSLLGDASHPHFGAFTKLVKKYS